ncbi:hypothetical protein [Sphingomicrobium aestuariivivum]|uniref:hypothetical protein n=1 Tax=Sphingomicrobium aestuariivivum TaxID=1582356 RepID=UPI001FD717A8|nr:hypothetical protein [Sphingomicrobium aestuariivivum]MCJ8190698.1 hypothetical protein [Sphingomicrobium aestuariivivum]
MPKTISNIIAATAGAALLAAPLAAYPARDLSDLVGARGGQAEGELERRGFTYITGHKDNYASHTYWWHDRDDNCVHIVTRDGRYAQITDASRSDCNRKDGNSDAAAAIGVAAGVAILGALIAGSGHKKHHHDDGNHYNDVNDEAHYERGFADGTHHRPYHNYDSSRAYTSGYQAGIRQRDRHTSHHKNRGGYERTAVYNDLQGRRARDLDNLERRGFRQVDNFTSGNTRYAIWWREGSNQCVQATIADGRIYDIRDIGRHPRCR